MAVGPLTTPYVSLIVRRANGYSRQFSSLPPPVPGDPTTTASGSLGGAIASIADKLGMGEYVSLSCLFPRICV